MMWKESYKLGVEKIDAQHKKLFEKADELIREIEGEKRPEIYKEIIDFLQAYVIFHFNDEEDYLKSLGYKDIENHKKHHRELTEAVGKYSIKLQESDYAYDVVKHLAGMISSWLIYHVVEEDLKYTKKAKVLKDENNFSYIDCFVNSAVHVLDAIAGLKSYDITKSLFDEDIVYEEVFIEIDLVGDLKGKVILGFTKDFAMGVVERMILFTPTEIDELVCSALAEISNIVGGNGTINISKNGTACDICPPKILQNGLSDVVVTEKVILSTEVGKLSVSLCID